MTTALDGGGAEFVARTWASWLMDQGHVVTVALLSRTDTSSAVPGMRAEALGGMSHPLRVRHLTAIIRRDRPDVVLSLQAYPNVVAWWATRIRHRPALVTSERNITMREGESSPLRDRLVRALSGPALRRSDLVIAVSHAVAAVLVSAGRVRGDKVLVVPNPATAIAEGRGGAPHASPARRSGVDIVVPGRLVAQKRTALAIDAAAVLRDRGHDVRVTCFGRGPDADRLTAHAEAAGVDLDLAGWVPDWAEAAPGGAIALLPSYREGLGNVLIDAAVTGIRSVAVSNAYGVADAIVPGLTGELALTGDPRAVADAIERALLLPDPIDASAWVRRFSTDSSGRLLVTALETAITRRGGR